jgi:hypothetical protein
MTGYQPTIQLASRNGPISEAPSPVDRQREQQTVQRVMELIPVNHVTSCGGHSGAIRPLTL